MSLQSALQFLNDLSQNNNKAWFTSQRERYQLARAAFEDVVADLIGAFGAWDDLGTLLPKDCIFRINRDVRFSKDKSPYNAHMSAEIKRGGRHGQGRSYYLMVAPNDRSFFASGLYEPDKAALDRVRQQLALDAAPLREILSAPEFVRCFGSMSGESLKVAPAGYDRNHPNIDLIRYKQFLAVQHLPDREVLSKGLVAHLSRRGQLCSHS